MLKKFILILSIIFCMAYSASAQAGNSDTVNLKHQKDTSKVAPGKLPGFFSHGDNAKSGKDASDFSIDSKPYKPDRSKQPLIIVDGRKTSYRKLKKINVNYIKTIEILKDSVSIKKYGHKARNGVLVVTTKNATS